MRRKSGGRTLRIMFARRAVNIPRMIFSGKRLSVFLHVQIRSLCQMLIECLVFSM